MTACEELGVVPAERGHLIEALAWMPRCVALVNEIPHPGKGGLAHPGTPFRETPCAIKGTLASEHRRTASPTSQPVYRLHSVAANPTPTGGGQALGGRARRKNPESTRNWTDPALPPAISDLD